MRIVRECTARYCTVMELTQTSQSHRAVLLRLSFELHQRPVTALERTRHSDGVYKTLLLQAMALCVGEKSPLHGLDRIQSMPPLVPAGAERRTHDCWRRGGTILIAALELAFPLCTPAPKLFTPYPPGPRRCLTPS